jgi:tetratricopeptide (TPR) repeat protein
MAGDAQHAIQELRAFLDRDTSCAEAYALMGAALSMAGNRDTGLACLEHAVEMDPHKASYQFNLGCAYEQRGDAMHAIEHYRLAVHEDVNYTRAVDAVRRIEMALLTPSGHNLSEH